MFVVKLLYYRDGIAYSIWEGGRELQACYAAAQAKLKGQQTPLWVVERFREEKDSALVFFLVLCFLCIAALYALPVLAVTIVVDQFGLHSVVGSLAGLIFIVWAIQPWTKSTSVLGRMLEGLISPLESAIVSRQQPHPSTIWIRSKEGSLRTSLHKLAMILRHPLVDSYALPGALALAVSLRIGSFWSFLIYFFVSAVFRRELSHTATLVRSCWYKILAWFFIAPLATFVLAVACIQPYFPGITGDIPAAILLFGCMVGIWCYGARNFDIASVKIAIKGTIAFLNVLAAFSVIYVFLDGSRIFPPEVIAAASQAKIDDRSLLDILVRIVTFPYVLASITADLVWEVRTSKGA